MCMLHAVCDIDSFYWRNDVQLLLILFRASTFFLALDSLSFGSFFFSFPLSYFLDQLCDVVGAFERFSEHHRFIFLYEMFSLFQIFCGASRENFGITFFPLFVTSETVAKEILFRSLKLLYKQQWLVNVTVGMTTRKRFRLNLWESLHFIGLHFSRYTDDIFKLFKYTPKEPDHENFMFTRRHWTISEAAL